MRDRGCCGCLVGHLLTREENLVELPHSPLFVHSREGGVGLNLVSISSSLEVSNGGAYVGIVLGEGFDDGDSLHMGFSHFSSVALRRSFMNLGSWNQMNASWDRMAMSSVPSTLSDQ